MARRIMAAALAGLAIVFVFADQVPGAPTTSTTEPSLPELFGLGGTPQPEPLHLYPRRPGARYEDIEARADHKVQLGLDRLRLREWSRVPHDALPTGAQPAALEPYRTFGLVDGYVPRVTDTAGDLLRVRISHWGWAVDTSLHCVAARATDGALIVPYDVPTRTLPPASASTTPVTTSEGFTRLTATFFFPLDAYRGRLYLTCTHSLFNEYRAVWAIDV